MRIVFLLILLALQGCFPFSKTAEELVNQPLPVTRFYATDGRIVSSTDYYGKPTVLVFWAEWCSHCRRNMPRFNKLAGHPQYAGRVNFISVSIAEERDFEKFEKFVAQQQLNNVQHFFSGNGTADESYTDWKGEDIPHYYVISDRGVLIMQTHDLSDVSNLLEDEIIKR